MKRIYALILSTILVCMITACGNDNQDAVLSEQTAPLQEETTTEQEETAQTFSDTWYDFSEEEPILDDSGDSETNDIQRVYAGHDENYIYVAFEVAAEDIDSTTMIHGGTCLFIGIDTPGYFMVSDNNKTVYADLDGNGEYCGQAAYKYEDGMLQIRVPLDIYDGATEFNINTVFRAQADGEKIQADKVDDFHYTIH